jgi:hypothetical protein
MNDIDPYNQQPEIPVNRLRERVIDQLKLNFAHDNLTVEDFEKRIDLAHGGDDRESLKKLIRDLPVLHDDTSPSYGSADSPVSWNSGRIRKNDTMIAVMGGVDRKGPWAPARYNKILAVMGGVDLDFTEAKFPPGTTELDIFCMMGGVDIIVPEGVNVEMSGIPLMGGFENKVGHGGWENGPTLKIRGVAIMGGVDVKPPKRKKRKKR